MTELTKEEKAAGRVFRDFAQNKLLETFETNPPDHQPPNFLSIFRHPCGGRGNRSTALELKERYEFSPSYVVYPTTDGLAVHQGDEEWAEEQVPGDYTIIPANRFGFIYKEGKCSSKGCGQTARSKAGRFVDAYERPPVTGRVARA